MTLCLKEMRRAMRATDPDITKTIIKNMAGEGAPTHGAAGMRHEYAAHMEHWETISAPVREVQKQIADRCGARLIEVMGRLDGMAPEFNVVIDDKDDMEELGLIEQVIHGLVRESVNKPMSEEQQAQQFHDRDSRGRWSGPVIKILDDEE